MLTTSDPQTQQDGAYLLQEYVNSIASKGNYKELAMEINKEISKSFEEPISIQPNPSNGQMAASQLSLETAASKLRAILYICELKLESSNRLMRRFFPFICSSLPLPNCNLIQLTSQSINSIIGCASPGLVHDFVEVLINLFNEWIKKINSWERYTVLKIMECLINKNSDSLNSYWEFLFDSLVELYFKEIELEDFMDCKYLIAQCICQLQNWFDSSKGKLTILYGKVVVNFKKSENVIILLHKMLLICLNEGDFYSRERNEKLASLFFGSYKKLRNLKVEFLQTVDAFVSIYPDEIASKFVDNFYSIMKKEFLCFPGEVINCCCSFIQSCSVDLDQKLKNIIFVIRESFNLAECNEKLIVFIRKVREILVHFTIENQNLIIKLIYDLFCKGRESFLFDNLFVDFCIECLRLNKIFIPKIHPFLFDLVGMILLSQSYSGVSIEYISVRSKNSNIEEIAFYALNSLFERIELEVNTKLLNFFRDITLKYLTDSTISTKLKTTATKCLLLWEEFLQNIEILYLIFKQCLLNSDCEFKLEVLRQTSPALDSLTSNCKITNIVVLLCNDSQLHVQIEALRILRRIVSINPIPILPIVHQITLNHLIMLEYLEQDYQTRHASFFIYLLITILGKNACPLIDSLFLGLFSKIDSRWTDASVNSLKSIQFMYRTCGKRAQKHTLELIPHLVRIISDSDQRKRLEALRTMGDAFFYSTIAHYIWSHQPHLLSFLLDNLRTKSQSIQINRQILRLLGLIGAIDPYKVNLMKKDSRIRDEQQPENRLVPTLSIPESSISDEFYPVIVINALMRIIQDANCPKMLRYDAYISCLRVFCMSPPRVMIHFEHVALFIVETVRSHKLLIPSDVIISACTELIMVGKEAVLPYLPDLIAFCTKNWAENSSFCETHLEFVHFIVAIKESVHYAVTRYLNQFIPFMLRMLNAFVDGRTVNSKHSCHDCIMQLISAFGTLTVYLDDYLLCILTPLLGLLCNPAISIEIKINIYGLFDVLYTSVNISRYWLLIWNTCYPLIGQLESELERQTFLFLYVLTVRYKNCLMLFNEMLTKWLYKVQMSSYAVKLVPFKVESKVINFDPNQTPSEMPISHWDEIPRGSKGDWDEWLKSFTIHLLLSSPNNALRISTELAVKYTPFAKELFYPAFLSNWSPVHQQYQEEIVQVVERALINPNVPSEIIHSFLNLAEFVEHDEKELPIDYKTLGAFSSKSHAYAKALHYRELEYLNDPRPSTVEALLSINTQLQLPDAATGILNHSLMVHSIELRENWYEKLHRWQEALKVYQQKLIANPNNDDAFIGLLRCKHVLGDWEDIFTLVQQRWPTATEQIQTTIAPLAAASAWSLSNWKELDEYLYHIKEESPEGCFFRAISFVHQENFQKAQLFIDRTRDSVATDIAGLLNESYNRAYNAMIRVQLLTELEEIIIYKTNLQERANIEKLWSERLTNVQPNVDVWHRILKVRSLLFSHMKNLPAWLDFLSLCRRQDRIFIGVNTLKNILAEVNLDLTFLQSSSTYTSIDPRLVLTSIKFAWELEGKEKAMLYLKSFIDKLIEQVSQSVTPTSATLVSPEQFVLSKSFRAYGNWLTKYKNKGITKENMEQVLNSYSLSTKYDPTSFKAWHRWALANFELVSLIERKNDPELRIHLPVYLCNTVKGFLRAISLDNKQQDILQDVLRFVTILFKYGSNHEINQIITEGFSKISVEAWLKIIPQVIARIHAPSPHVRRLVHQILLDVARVHPQSIIYSLMVAAKSQNPTRRAAASSLIEKMRTIHPVLVEHAMIVSNELIRISVLWHEMWHEGLEEASRRYFGDKNVNGMFAVLNPLHQVLERGPETPLEFSFVQSFGKELREAREWCTKYHTSGNISDINQAWDLYYAVFRELSKQIMHYNVINLEQASPRLLEIHDLELSVPGTDSPSNRDNLVQIHRVNPILLVISSKQRPRKVEIFGNDGKSYCYLLKGREDIRQDQRVMQFFSLVNNCLKVDLETSNRHLKIRTFPVIPLSPNSGLIGWVDDCDTLHSLIKEYRENHSVLLNIEHRLMLQMAPDYDNLTSLQKIEIFEHALQSTSGLDLAKILWLRSRNSEQWLERRTVYIRSLAVMSIVGYVLGLGDRHPSNLLIDRCTGIVVHIDFGDCFEAAMMREKFPEQIPFRLTRMLVYAMEASGVEGSFRITCEHTMRVLRLNRESLMAILEAFIYDPLVTSKINPPKMAELSGRAAAVAIGEEQSSNQAAISVARTWYYPADAEIERDPENVNAKALQLVRRVSNKLSGRDFGTKVTPMDISSQVDKLINEATSVANLSQCYVGWCPFW